MIRRLMLTSGLLVSACTASHTVGGADADGGGRSSSPRPAGSYMCSDAQTQAIHGTACEGGGGCGTAVGPPWYTAECFDGEWLAVRGDVDNVPADSACTGIDMGDGRMVEFRMVDGACFDIVICQPGSASWPHYAMCQADGRPGLRGDAVSTPFTDCDTALASARDGDPCSGDLRCYGTPGSGRNVFLYCDAAGITRLLGGSGIGRFVEP